MTVPDGRTLRFNGKEKGPEAELIVHDPKFVRTVLTKGDIGFAEVFMDGKVDTPDLPALLEYFNDNWEDAGNLAIGNNIARFFTNLRHMLRSNTKKGSKRNILAHYDLGNEFYSAWLDATMTYSSAIFTTTDQDLKDAQLEKYRSIARNLRLEPGQHVLEIGSGWGGFAEVAAKEFGARVTSITISNAQHAFATQRMKDAGLEGQVEIVMRDYRDVTGQFDAVASIEMFEAVGEEYWPSYFGKIAEVLKPGGRAALQIITIDDKYFDGYRRRADFIQTYIFPGGMLPSPQRLKEETERAGMAFAHGQDVRARSMRGRWMSGPSGLIWLGTRSGREVRRTVPPAMALLPCLLLGRLPDRTYRCWPVRADQAALIPQRYRRNRPKAGVCIWPMLGRRMAVPDQRV